MIIVKMNDTTVECSIAASELHEIGLTPEAVINGAENTSSFFAKLNKEVGQQLGYDPETEVMMMSKNMMMDGSIRIFAVKMSNEDIQTASDRIKGAAETVLRILTQEKVDEIKSKNGRDKGIALNEVITNVSEAINRIYGRDKFYTLPEETTKTPETSYQPLSEYDTFDEAKRFSKVVQKLPIVDSSLYKLEEGYYMILGLLSSDESVIYDLRRAGVEYSNMLVVNATEAMYVREHGDRLVGSDAIIHLTDLSR